MSDSPVRDDDAARIAAAAKLIPDVGKPDIPAEVPNQGNSLPNPGTQGAQALPPQGTDSLADLIRQDREERAQRAKAEQESATWKQKAEALEKELTKFQAEHDDFVLDPIGFADRRKLTAKERAIAAEALLYDLVEADKVPSDWRAKLLEMKMNRRDRLAMEERQAEAERANKAAEESARAAAVSSLQNYRSHVEQTVKSWEKESVHPYPFSASWFKDESDDYHQSLVKTASNIAESAKARGEPADLSPRNVARVLEDYLVAKHQRVSGSSKTAVVTQSQKPAGAPVVAQDKPSESPPRKKMTPEEERIYRATQVVFST